MVFGGVWALFKVLLLGWALGWGRLHMGPLGDVPVCHRPLGLMDRRSFGLQSYFAWLVFQVLVLKVGVPGVGCKPSSPQGELSSFEFPPDCGLHHWGWGLQWDCVSALPTHFDVVSLLFSLCEGIIPPVFTFFFSRGNCSIHSYRSNVFVGGSKFRILLHHHLELVITRFLLVSCLLLVKAHLLGLLLPSISHLQNDWKL